LGKIILVVYWGQAKKIENGQKTRFGILVYGFGILVCGRGILVCGFEILVYGLRILVCRSVIRTNGPGILVFRFAILVWRSGNLVGRKAKEKEAVGKVYEWKSSLSLNPLLKRLKSV
jgi:hypothetical protein